MYVKAHKLYPVRLRVINAVTNEAEWHTIAYVPVLSTEKGSAGAERSRLRRMAVLQRVLYLAFRTTITASHNGFPVDGGEHGPLMVFPRLLLYLCDQPEERAVLCLKPGLCQRPCTLCDVALEDLGDERALKAKERCPLALVERQLEAHSYRMRGQETARRNCIEKALSINGLPSALASMAGLCTPPFLMCKIIAVDVLHVRHFSPLSRYCIATT